MALQINISGATPKSGKSLCTSCKYAKIVRGQNCEEYIACHAHLFDGPVPFRVAECNSYHPSNMPWLSEMHEMAWKIEARKRGPAGFENPKNESEMEVVITKPRSRDEKYQIALPDSD